MINFEITKKFELSEGEIMELYFESIGMKWMLNEKKISNYLLLKNNYE